MTRQTHMIKSTFLIVDRQFSFIIDIKDDTKENLIDVASSASYYSSKSGTESYSYIFETVWRQADLYDITGASKQRSQRCIRKDQTS